MSGVGPVSTVVTIVEHYFVEGSVVISLRNGFLAQGRLAPPTVERRQHLTGVVAVLKCTSNSLTASIEYATDVQMHRLLPFCSHAFLCHSI
jgi:hypothetical protein